eukprot:Clim_evm7s53 gene=Clim_evmTU7s53
MDRVKGMASKAASKVRGSTSTLDSDMNDPISESALPRSGSSRDELQLQMCVNWVELLDESMTVDLHDGEGAETDSKMMTMKPDLEKYAMEQTAYRELLVELNKQTETLIKYNEKQNKAMADFADTISRLGEVHIAHSPEGASGKRLLNFSVVLKEATNLQRTVNRSVENSVGLFTRTTLRQVNPDDFPKVCDKAFSKYEDGIGKIKRRKNTDKEIMFLQSEAEKQKCQMTITKEMSKIIDLERRVNYEMVRNLGAYIETMARAYENGTQVMTSIQRDLETLEDTFASFKERNERERTMVGTAMTSLLARQRYLETLATEVSGPGAADNGMDELEQRRRSLEVDKAQVRDLEGYLYKKDRRIPKLYSKRWLALHDGQLQIYHDSSKDLKNMTRMALVTASVKEDYLDGRDVFTVVTPGKSYTFHTDGDSLLLQRWVNTLRRAIGHELGDFMGTTATTTENGKVSEGDGFQNSIRTAEAAHQAMRATLEGSKSADSLPVVPESGATDLLEVGATEHELYERLLQSVPNVLGNSVCADCRKAWPSWISVNLGAVLCMSCAGIHRDLGVNHSRIKSLELDELDSMELLLPLCIGNDRLNEIYLADLPDREARQLGPNSSMQERKAFINNKYVDGRYMTKSIAGDEGGGIEANLQRAIESGDVAFLLSAHAHGMGMNSTTVSVDGSDVPLACHAATVGRLESLYFLLKAAPQKEVVDMEGRSALHCAIAAGQLGCVKLLVQAGLPTRQEDNSGVTPMALAVRTKNEAMEEALQSHDGHLFSSSDVATIPALEPFLRGSL